MLTWAVDNVLLGTYNIELVNDSLYEWNVKLTKWAVYLFTNISHLFRIWHYVRPLSSARQHPSLLYLFTNIFFPVLRDIM